MVDALDNAILHIQAHGQAKVCVNRYGNAIVNKKETGSGIVKIIEKHKKTF
jgi:hypothetical protein